MNILTKDLESVHMKPNILWCYCTVVFHIYYYSSSRLTIMDLFELKEMDICALKKNMLPSYEREQSMDTQKLQSLSSKPYLLGLWSRASYIIVYHFPYSQSWVIIGTSSQGWY